MQTQNMIVTSTSTSTSTSTWLLDNACSATSQVVLWPKTNGCVTLTDTGLWCWSLHLNYQSTLIVLQWRSQRFVTGGAQNVKSVVTITWLTKYSSLIRDNLFLHCKSLHQIISTCHNGIWTWDIFNEGFLYSFVNEQYLPRSSTYN